MNADLPVDLDVQAVKELLDNDSIVLVDCREQDEYNLVRIDGYVLIPMSEIQNRLRELEAHKSEHIVVHCHHGGRSRRVTNWLRQQGYDKVQNMAGGIDDWSVQIAPDLPRY